MPHDFCRRLEIICYVNAMALRNSCYILNFKHFHHENGFIVITLLKSKVIFRKKSESLKRARNIFREPARGE